MPIVAFLGVESPKCWQPHQNTDALDFTVTNIPDSSWLLAIHKVSWWVSSAIVITCSSIIALYYFDISIFKELDPIFMATTGIVGLLFFFLLAFRIIDKIGKSFKNRVALPFRKLPVGQKEFLIQKYRTGYRDFEIEASIGTPRWIEELANWRYIEWISPMIFTADTPSYYAITEAGWNEIKKHQDRQHEKV